MKKKAKDKVAEESFIDLGEVNMKEVVTFAENRDVNFVPLSVYFLYDDVEEPKYQTDASACFDIPVYLAKDKKSITIYNRLLTRIEKTIFTTLDYKRGFYIEPGECAYVPTGLVFDIPPGFKLSLYPRSGVASKRHLKLANSVGIIDEDFTDELMMLIYNDSQEKQTIYHNDRLVQAEITPIYRAIFEKSEFEIEIKGNRDGGFGSTGGITI